MNDVSAGLGARATALRLDFDRAFSRPAEIDETIKEDLLAVSLAGEAHAIRLSEISGLFADKKITPVPGGAPALLGIAGFRGAILPVYDLQFCLGHSRAHAPRWLVVAAREPVALAFEAFDGQRRISRDMILPRSTHSERRSHRSHSVQAPEFRGPIIDLASILDALKT